MTRTSEYDLTSAIHGNQLTPFAQDLVWCMLPNIDLLQRRLYGPHIRYKRALFRPLWNIRNMLKHDSETRMCHLHIRGAGSALIVNKTTNQWRTMVAVEGALASRYGGGGASYYKHAAPPSNDFKARAAARSILYNIKAAGTMWQNGTLDSLRGRLLRTAGALSLFERLLSDLRPSVLIVATQHCPTIRALLLVARRQGVPSVYFPHAPLARNRQYADIPTDFAGLRGIGELDVLSAKSDSFNQNGVDIVGDPGIRDFVEPSLDAARAPVFALSPGDPADVRQQMALVARGVPTDCIVAPHPRSRLRNVRRHLPDGWKISSRDRTLDLLLEGHPYLVQKSSGVALESLLLGVPAVQLNDRGVEPNYYFIDSRYVPMAACAEDLRALHGALCETGSSATARSKLTGWAKYWCAHTGKKAVQLSGEVVARAFESGQQDVMILDGWSS